MEQAEQRRYRRLEVSLPVWLAEEDNFDRPGQTPWSLGYTRDVSMGGAKVYVPETEEAKWQEVEARGANCLIRFDVPGCSPVEYISCHVRRAAREMDSGRFWIGIEYNAGNVDEKAAAMRAGMRTMKARRRWQIAFLLALAVLLISAFFINKLRTDVARQEQLVAAKEKQRRQLNQQLSLLSRAGLVSTRAEGINSSFKRKRVQALISDLNRLNDPDNQNQVEQERATRRLNEGIELPSTSGANVTLGVALPYGYAWPLVTDNLEQLLGRNIPLVVTFRDFKSPFPLEDCLEARARHKTLQITWEPWLFPTKQAVRLRDIARGKHDKYIDSWASAAKSFGSEVWIRWGHEFNGNWYPWSTSANGQSTRDYIAAYRHIHSRFTRTGAFNVRWTWCINAETVPNTSWNDPLRAYPGDAYVDMISIDGYNFGTTLPSSRWQSFAEVFAEPYAKIVRRFPNKPLMINETACATVGGPTGTERDKAQWIRDMDTVLRRTFPRISAVVWFETEKEADWRMVSSPATREASRQIWRQAYYRRGET
jgi:hypothetical protein